MALGKKLQEQQGNDQSRFDRGFLLCLGREPTSEERAVLADLVEAQRKTKANDVAIWNGLARTLLNLDAFSTRE